MRDRESWRKPILAQVKPQWPDTLGEVPPELMCDVELGLYLMDSVVPGQPVIAGWTLLGGYPFAGALGYVRTPEHERMLRVARHYLWSMRRRRQWLRALEAYRRVPQHLRGYEVPDDQAAPQRRPVAVAAGRFQRYDNVLHAAPQFARQRLPIAAPGTHRFFTGRRITSVHIPSELPQPPVVRHDLTQQTDRQEPLSVSMADLQETAAWMDARLAECDGVEPRWQATFARTELQMPVASTGQFASSDRLTVDRVLHMVGMVGAGKSTLRDILAVWAARRGLRTILVVGDVAEELELVELFRRLKLRAAPVIGWSTRERHVQRLHRRQATAGLPTLLAHTHPGFTFLSTACPVDALRGTEVDEPLPFTDGPCTSLYPVRKPRTHDVVPGLGEIMDTAAGDDSDDRSALGPRHGCPLWMVCPRHRGARDLVDADIWVANPASLVHSVVPQHQNEERLHYLELACRRSDLVIVDEADRVQMQFDAMFAPATTLVGRSPNSWLDEVQAHKISELARDGRIQLTDREVDLWSGAANTVSTATDRLYAMLVQDADIRTWASEDYFSAWTLQQQLLDGWYPLSETGEDAGKDEELRTAEASSSDRESEFDIGEQRRRVRALLDAFHDDPLGERRRLDPEVGELVRLTQELLLTTSGEVRIRVKDWVRALPGLSWPGDADLEQTARRFEFTLLLTALHTRLDLMTGMWPRVEAMLNLDSTSNLLSRRPPADYQPVIPESPMGNVLGFQFRLDDQPRSDGQSGELRFFRCSGVGRELLLGLHALTHADGLSGPQVILMSGTSWAGTSTRYHLQVPVGAILTPPAEEIKAITESVFRTEFLVGRDGRPLRLSGSPPTMRPRVLEQMLHVLGRSAIEGEPSPLAQELADIDDPNRRRILLLVGSYEEAKRATQILDELPEWAGKVCRLVSDDADLDHLWQPLTSTSKGKVLRRGDVATFGETGAKLLVAPLLAVERGHNILNSVGQAAIGSVYFLARPHPRPDDIALAIQAINDWVVRSLRDGTFDQMVRAAGDLDSAGRAFRRQARGRFRRLLTRRLAWSSLPEDEKVSFTWDQLVVIWQVIGRLVRGGVPARVHFVDAAFSPREAGLTGVDTQATSLLHSMRGVLDPYFTDSTTTSALDRHLVCTLYEPLYTALCRMS